MASYTPNYNLKKPDYSDTADIKDINNNMDKIDTALNDKVTSHGSASLLGLKINNTGSVSDVITFGGGDPDWGSGNVGGIMYSHDARQYFFRGKGSVNGNNEDFVLPAHSDGNSNRVYNILTTKDFPFVRIAGQAYGGSVTFDATAGVRHAIIFCASFFFHLICNNNTDNIVYADNLPSAFTLVKNGATYTLARNNGSGFNYVILWI